MAAEPSNRGLQGPKWLEWRGTWQLEHGPGPGGAYQLGDGVVYQNRLYRGLRDTFVEPSVGPDGLSAAPADWLAVVDGSGAAEDRQVVVQAKDLVLSAQQDVFDNAQIAAGAVTTVTPLAQQVAENAGVVTAIGADVAGKYPDIVTRTDQAAQASTLTAADRVATGADRQQTGSDVAASGLLVAQAQTAATAALFNGKVYLNDAAGLAATPSGSTYFRVSPTQAGFADLVLNNGGTPVPTGKTVPSDVLVSKLDAADRSLSYDILYFGTAYAGSTGVYLDSAGYVVGIPPDAVAQQAKDKADQVAATAAQDAVYEILVFGSAASPELMNSGSAVIDANGYVVSKAAKSVASVAGNPDVLAANPVSDTIAADRLRGLIDASFGRHVVAAWPPAIPANASDLSAIRLSTVITDLKSWIQSPANPIISVCIPNIAFAWRSGLLPLWTYGQPVFGGNPENSAFPAVQRSAIVCTYDFADGNIPASGERDPQADGTVMPLNWQPFAAVVPAAGRNSIYIADKYMHYTWDGKMVFEQSTRSDSGKDLTTYAFVVDNIDTGRPGDWSTNAPSTFNFGVWTWFCKNFPFVHEVNGTDVTFGCAQKNAGKQFRRLVQHQHPTMGAMASSDFIADVPPMRGADQGTCTGSSSGAVISASDGLSSMGTADIGSRVLYPGYDRFTVVMITAADFNLGTLTLSQAIPTQAAGTTFTFTNGPTREDYPEVNWNLSPTLAEPGRRVIDERGNNGHYRRYAYNRRGQITITDEEVSFEETAPLASTNSKECNIRLSSGRLLKIWNRSSQRFNMCGMLTPINGEGVSDWYPPFTLDNRNIPVSYPDAVELRYKDGRPTGYVSGCWDRGRGDAFMPDYTTDAAIFDGRVDNGVTPGTLGNILTITSGVIGFPMVGQKIGASPSYLLAAGTTIIEKLSDTQYRLSSSATVASATFTTVATPTTPNATVYAEIILVMFNVEQFVLNDFSSFRRWTINPHGAPAT